MKGTFRLPDGLRIRVASQRRYVVVAKYDDGTRVRWIVVKRSDKLPTLTGWKHLSRGDHIIDTTTGEVVR